MKKAIILFLACAAFVSAFTGTGGGVTRTIKVLERPPDFPHSFDVLGVRSSAGTVDAVNFFWTTNWIPRHVIEFYEKSSDTVYAFFGRWCLWKIIEWEPSSNSSVEGYVPGESTYVSGYTLWLRGWTEMTLSKETIDGATVFSLCTSLSPFFNDSAPHPDVTICLHAANQAVTVNNTLLGGDKIKWSLYIADYPYESDSSYLAIKSSFDSARTVRDLNSTMASYDPEEESGVALDSDGNGNHAVASWATWVSVTGEGCDENATVIRSAVYEGQQTGDVDNYPSSLDPDDLSTSFHYRVVYHSFMTNCYNPGSIYWDPEVGVAQDESSASSVSSIFLLSLALVVLLLSL